MVTRAQLQLLHGRQACARLTDVASALPLARSSQWRVTDTMQRQSVRECVLDPARHNCRVKAVANSVLAAGHLSCAPLEMHMTVRTRAQPNAARLNAVDEMEQHRRLC